LLLDLGEEFVQLVRKLAELVHRHLPAAEAAPGTAQLSAAADQAASQLHGILDHRQGPMRRLLRHGDDIVEPLPRIRNLVLGQLGETAVQAERLERLVQLSGQPAELAKQFGLANMGELVDQPLDAFHVAGTDALADRLRHLQIALLSLLLLHDAQSPARTRSKIRSIFSFSVFAVNGLTM